MLPSTCAWEQKCPANCVAMTCGVREGTPYTHFDVHSIHAHTHTCMYTLMCILISAFRPNHMAHKVPLTCFELL